MIGLFQPSMSAYQTKAQVLLRVIKALSALDIDEEIVEKVQNYAKNDSMTHEEQRDVDRLIEKVCDFATMWIDNMIEDSYK